MNSNVIDIEVAKLKDELFDLRCEYVKKNTQVEELMNEIRQLAAEAQKIDVKIAGLLDEELKEEEGGDDDGPQTA